MSIDGGLSDRLLSIEVHDEAETKSDRVTINLDDRARWSDDAVAAMPEIGKVVTVRMGYLEGPAADRGTFIIDDLTVTSPPRSMTVTGRAADMPKSYRTPRTESYHQKTLGEIMGEIAGRNGYSAAIDSSLSGIIIRHIDQRNESDMAFATRLAAMHDGVARPMDGKLAVGKRGTGKTMSGAAMPVISLTEADCSDWTFKYSARDEAGKAGGIDGGGGSDQAAAAGTKPASTAESDDNIIDLPGGSEGSEDEAGGVRAYWTDIRTGEQKEVTAGQEPFHDMRFTYHNESEARAAVDAFKNQSARGKATFDCTIGGNPAVQAEAVLLLVNFRAYIPLKWRIKTAVHRFDGDAYTTTISAELFEPKQEDVPKKVGQSKPAKDDLIDKDAPTVTTKPVGGEEYIIKLPGEK